MFLTCSRCQSTYFVDDQIYAQSGGGVCEQCQIPLVPAQNQSPQAWGQPSDAQWGQQPSDAQWGQQPADAQWGQQPAPTQWNQSSLANNPQWNQQNQQWGQAPNDVQWGQQPGGWGTNQDWSQLADKPKETEALLQPLDIDEPIVHHERSGEKTIAIGQAWDDESAGIIEQSVVPGIPKRPASRPPQLPRNAQSQPDDDWNAWGSTPQKPASSPAPKRPGNPQNAVVIGRPMAPENNESITREIDIKQIHILYHDKVNPVAEFFKSIPIRYLIILGSVLLVTIIAAPIAAHIINKPEKAETKFTEEGDIITEDTPEKVRTFDDIVAASKALSSNFMPLDGDNVHDGSIVAVTKADGVFYDEKKIASFAEINAGQAFVEKLQKAALNDDKNQGKPIYFLFDETIPMSAVYRTMYSFGASSRPVKIAGVTHNGITTINVTPCAWPDHGMVTFPECNLVTIDLKITRIEMTMRRIIGEEPLILTAEGEPVLELRDDIISNKVRLQNISAALSKLRSSTNSSVRLSPDGDITFGIFMLTLDALRGSLNNPSVKEMHLQPVPLL